jgi:sulfur-oxidizing protein SoxY
MKLSILLPPNDSRKVILVTLIIDENPAPVAVAFKLGAKAKVSMITTRVRVNQYTNVHAVAELSDGSLYTVSHYVKAAGGCSAPATKNPDEANATLGEMRFRQVADAGPGETKTGAAANAKEAILMIRHPNNSGLQMDQVTHLYTPARYVDSLQLFQGEDLIFSVEGGISVSEDPNFRFIFISNGAREVHAIGKDTSGTAFHGDWTID